MKTGAEAVLPLAEDRQTASVTPIRPLRDLRDDGVTVGYMARMYGVEQGMMEEMISALGLGAR